MKAEARTLHVESLVARTDEPGPLLCEQVRLAIQRYFEQLDGHSTNNLYEMVIQEVERPLIQTVLAYCGHNQSKAAQILGLSRSTLRKKMTQLGIE